MSDGACFFDALHAGVLIGDGAIGSELFARGATPDMGIERLNLLRPELVLQLHQDYLAAGSRVIETNTFGANRASLLKYGAADDARELALAGARLARQAVAGGEAFVAGSIGPLAEIDGEPVSPAERTSLFAEQITALLEGGVDLLIFESFIDLDELTVALAIARSLTTLPVVAQMAFDRGGRTPSGDTAEAVATRCRAAGADLVGANCGYGASSVAAAITQMAPQGLPMSAYLNAGFPEQVEGRLFYVATPEYLARYARDLVAQGVRLLGGCCGTGPETIRSIAQAILHKDRPQYLIRMPEAPTRADLHPVDTPASVPSSPPPILVELDPPTNLDITPVLASARALQQAGVTGLTVADNPLASMRLDTLTMARLLQQETGLPVIPHLTGRDRNRIALQSTIMGAAVSGISSLLCVTGDPVRLCLEPNTSGVFDVTSVGLVRLVAEFNAGRRMSGGARTAFDIGVAVNPNVRTLSGQIDKLKRKVDAGASFALTQPLFEAERLDQWQEALAQAGITIPIYIGILPIISARNAEFLHNEVPGMRIPDEIRERLARYDTVADQRAAGIDIAADLVRRFAARVHGFYFMCPRNRIDPILPLIAAARGVNSAPC
ncbi:MAG TPA: bifunctional homocysteine S-methyltransferase/methylenetetrahydrofolate reductase [Armatimonadota bacterium]|jgi:homocysteine S-methyltransferase